MMTCKENRDKAYDICQPRKHWLALVYLIVGGICGAVSSLGYSAPIVLFIIGPFELAVTRIIIDNYNGKDVEIKKVFSGFDKKYWKNVAVGALMYLYIFLWSLLFIIPGIIKCYAYSMTMYIYNENPELSAKECINKSEQMMYGHKWQLFKLDLSYIAWILLCIVTCGVLAFWVEPRMETSHYLFYKELTENQPVEVK